MSPRFIYMGSAQAAAQFDLTWVIVAVTGAVRLFIGAKEYTGSIQTGTRAISTTG